MPDRIRSEQYLTALSSRILCRTLLHHVEQVRTACEGTHHAGCSFVKHSVLNMVKQKTFDLKADPIWISAVGNGRDVAIALSGFLLLQRWKVPPLIIVIFCVATALLSAAVP